MFFEETTRGVDERVVGDRVNQIVDASFDILGRFGFFDRTGEHDFEGFQRELVHRMDARKIVHDEVDQTSTSSSWSIQFSSFVDLHRSDLRFADFLFDFRRRSFGVFKIFHQGRITEKVRTSR